MTTVFHGYADVLEFVQARRNGSAARLRAHDNAVRAGSGTRVGKLTRDAVRIEQGQLLALDSLLADLMHCEFENPPTK